MIGNVDLDLLEKTYQNASLGNQIRTEGVKVKNNPFYDKIKSHRTDGHSGKYNGSDTDDPSSA